MLHFLDEYRDITTFTVLLRMLLAFFCGGIIGLERSYKNRPAGFRTHILVCFGATVASMTGIYLAVNREFPTDLSRLGAQVVSGLGFIGGGTILVTKKKKIKGLTTAAGLWTTGIIGLAIGAGFYEGALLTSLLVLIVQIIFARISRQIKRKPVFHLEMCYREKTVLDQILRYCKDNRYSISNLKVTGSNESDEPLYTALISLRSHKYTTIDTLLAHIEQTAGVISAEVVTF
ncbi:MAG: MgtC/SapB family protein [Oscillospiraceae bacterium]|nr:MgtC/SapB family protein [Oscillospiraceae bacterium]